MTLWLRNKVKDFCQAPFLYFVYAPFLLEHLQAIWSLNKLDLWALCPPPPFLCELFYWWSFLGAAQSGSLSITDSIQKEVGDLVSVTCNSFPGDPMSELRVRDMSCSRCPPPIGLAAYLTDHTHPALRPFTLFPCSLFFFSSPHGRCDLLPAALKAFIFLVRRHFI